MNTPQPIIPNSFESVLRNQRKGILLADLSNALEDAVLAVREHCAPATVTLTLRIEPATGDAAAVSVHDDIATKLPKPRKANTLFFSTEDGRLVRDDPNQAEMKFQTVPTTSTPDREAIAS